MQLSLMLLCRLLNKAPTANNVGAESRRSQPSEEMEKTVSEARLGAIERLER